MQKMPPQGQLLRRSPRRRVALAIVSSLALVAVAGVPGVAAADGSGATYQVRAPTEMPAHPLPVSSSVVGVQSPAATNALLDSVAHSWRTMAWTLYAHRTVVDTATGHYQFDCVGATNHFMAVATPHANDALRAAEHIRRFYVPSPTRLAAYLASLPSSGTSTWKPTRQASQIGPGEIIAVPPAPGSTEPGHAMITAGPAVALANGDVAVLVFDSTAAPGHGPFDSRRWDVRDQPLRSPTKTATDRRSGLGYGTVEVTTTPTGGVRGLLWSVGGRPYGGQIAVAQPLS